MQLLYCYSDGAKFCNHVRVSRVPASHCISHRVLANRNGTAMVCLQHGSQHGVTRQCDGPNLWFASLLYSKQKSPWPKATGLESGVSIPFFNILSRSFLVQSGCEIFRGEDSDTEPFCSVPRLHLRKKIERCVLLSTVPACILLFLV